MAERKREQIEADLRTIIKGSKKSIFVKLSLTDLIENSRRMYLIYNVHKSGEKFNLNNDDDKISLLRKIDFDFQNLESSIKKIPKPLKELLDRKWEKDPNSKQSREGSTSIILKNLTDLHAEFSQNLNYLDQDISAGKIYNKNDEEECADYILEYLNSDSKRKESGKLGRKRFLKTFRADIMAKKYKEILFNHC